jgi:hypothetical protein
MAGVLQDARYPQYRGLKDIIAQPNSDDCF